VDSLQATIAEALKHGDEQVAQVLRLSQEALSHLQFQDPCAQRLLQIEADVLHVQENIQLCLETGDVTSLERLRSADSHRSAGAGHVMVFDEDQRDDEDPGSNVALAGELLLF
jgi:hypothetical protein